MTPARRHLCLAALASALAASPGASAQQVPSLGAAAAVALAPHLASSRPEALGADLVALHVTGDEGSAVAGAFASALAAPLRTVQAEGVDGARRAGAARLVTVTVRGRRATATLEVVDPGPWFTFLAGAPPAVARVASVEVGAEPAAARWPAAPPGRPRVVPTPFRGTAALALADLDGDGRDELVLAGERVQVARLQGASVQFVPDGRGAVPPRAPVPLRQPVGSASFDPARRIVRIRTSAHAAMAEVSLAAGAVELRATAVDLYPAQGVGCVALRPGTAFVASVSEGCDASLTPVGARVAAAPVAHGSGGERWAVSADGAGRAELRRGGVVVATLDDVAPPLVLDDLDGDGAVELVAASGAAPGGADRVRVFTLRDRPEARAPLAVPGPVEAMAAGDLDGDGRRELVVSVLDPARRTSTLWILP